MSSVILHPLSGRAQTMTIWAARLLAAIALLHLVLFYFESSAFHADWVSGGLWGEASMQFGRMPESGGMFWAWIGSFAVPLFLLSALIAQLARAGHAVPVYVHWVLGAWLLIGGLIYEPGGFPVGLILVGILLTADRMRRRSAHSADNARTTASA